jgi:hypothetical protein
MFAIELYGVGPDGKPVGPERAPFDGDNIDDAIEQAELLIRDSNFRFGKAKTFKIYDDDRRLVYDSEAD